MQLKNAKVLVTGGSLGLGRETARLLIEKGAQVVITGRNAGRLEKAASEIGAIPVAADIGTPEGQEATISGAVEALGGLDVLINNAGIGTFHPLGELSLEDFQKVFDVNLFGLAMVTQKALPYFRKAGKGHIINIASTAATKGFASGSVYASSKFALRGMTQCWQAELRKDNIRVILVNPSEVPTAFNQPDRQERDQEPNKLSPTEIAHTIIATLEMDDRGFIPEVSVWATNPF